MLTFGEALVIKLDSGISDIRLGRWILFSRD